MTFLQDGVSGNAVRYVFRAEAGIGSLLPGKKRSYASRDFSPNERVMAQSENSLRMAATVASIHSSVKAGSSPPCITKVRNPSAYPSRQHSKMVSRFNA